MADFSWAGVSWDKGGVSILLLFWILVPPSFMQPPLPLSLPVRMSVVPPAWQFLPLSQVELGPIFSNSTPFSFSQSLFMLRPPGEAPRPEHVEIERDEGRQKSFRVRTLFHKRGDNSTQGTCVTLHAFKDTEEHKASCITQPPLGLCVVTLTLPSDWFEDHHTGQSHQDLVKWHTNPHHRRRMQKRERQRRGNYQGKVVSHQHTTSPSLRYPVDVDDTKGHVPWALRHQRVPSRNQIQLYYSSSDTVADLHLTPPGCVENRAAQSQRQLFHIKAVTLKEKQREQSRTKGEEETCLNEEEEEELSVDPHVTIRYHRGPVLVGQPIRVSLNLRANFSGDLVIIRLKVKKGLVSMVAQKTLTTDFWAVTLERSQGSKHDVVSILPTLLQQVVCLSVHGLRQSFGVAMAVSANWWAEYSGHIQPRSPHGAAVSIFSFADRHIFSIAPITESNRIINTAILTNQPVSLPVIVLAINHNGKVSDVTSAVTCHSTNENTVKVSSDCSTLFVDGSESGVGNTCAVVEFLLGALRGSVCVEVWAPSLPLRVSLADPVLNAIDGWNHFTNTGCVPVYQRSSIQVLTQFTAQDPQSRTTHLLGSSDWFVDVTELVVSEQWDGVLGRCDVTVTSDPVTPWDLSVQVISGLGMSVTANPTNPSIVTTTVTAYNILYNHHQEASISIWLQFSDDTASLLSSFSDVPFFLRLSSLAETVAVVMPGSSPRIFAQGDGGGPLLPAELLVSTCTDQPITSNSISEGTGDWTDTGRGGGARRLARGSGWIRVNLDLGFLQPVGDDNDEGDKFDLDISGTLAESDSDIYASNFDEDENENISIDYDDKISGNRPERYWNQLGYGEMVSRNNLERAVLMPSQEEGAVYFSPSQEKDGKWEEEVEGRGARELEVGVGVVLSLLCLSAVLFLVNCLPCVLRDRRRTTMEKETEEELEGGTRADEEEERQKREGDDEMKQQQKTNNTEDEVEIMC
ncbi:Transmembrane protein 132C [Liparis tanakae]|uniref:Transmembrane protein 132C n=1 Tax=Liparis tanakae TaxID=230148 RepID=A0A4Z2IJC5_9TELE|nr:Transmembrane protein 132C [Liparis tanakae]